MAYDKNIAIIKETNRLIAKIKDFKGAMVADKSKAYVYLHDIFKLADCLDKLLNGKRDSFKETYTGLHKQVQIDEVLSDD